MTYQPITKFWNYEIDGTEKDMQEISQQAAQKYADEKFADSCDDAGVKNAKEPIFLIEYTYDESADEFLETNRVKSWVSYGHYHGDHAEHFSQSMFV